MFHKCKDQEDVKTLFRKLALRLHPDHGGDHQLMILLQENYDMVRISEGSLEVFKMVCDQLAKMTPIAPETRSEEKKPPPPPPPQPEKESKGGFRFKKKEAKGKYDMALEDLHDGDPELEILDDIFAYAKSHKKFSTDFVESIVEYLETHGYITSSQYNSLVKIYYAFRMNEQHKQK